MELVLSVLVGINLNNHPLFAIILPSSTRAFQKTNTGLLSINKHDGLTGPFTLDGILFSWTRESAKLEHLGDDHICEIQGRKKCYEY